MNDIIGIDFSINKPAVCIFSKNSYNFMSWPHKESIKSNIVQLYESAGVEIIKRTDDKHKKLNSTESMRWELDNSEYLTGLIINSLRNILKRHPHIAFEGLSYGSSGNRVTQLAGYKYILMNKINKYVPKENMFTYAPITIKKTAGCANKGSKKKDIIRSFVDNESDVKFSKFIKENESSFLKKGGNNWIDHLDDFVDSYYLVKTLINNELS